MRVWRKSLVTRALILFLVLALTPVALVSVLGYRSGRRSLTANVHGHLENVAILKEQEVGEWVEHLGQTLAWLATSPDVREAAHTLAMRPPGDNEYEIARDTLVTELRRIETLEHLKPVLLLDGTSGEIVVASNEAWEGEFREKESWFHQGRARPVVSSVDHSQHLDEATLVIATPLRDDRGRLLGVLAGHANMAALDTVMLERTGMGETGETYLVSADNLLITKTRFDASPALTERMFTEGVTRALAGESGVGAYRGYRGEVVIGAYRWLEDLGVAVLAEMDEAEAYAPVSTLLRTTLMIGGGTGVAVILLGAIVTRAFTQPVRRLAAGAEEIGRGNLDHRVAVDTEDEIGQLSQAFNQMAEELQTSQERAKEALALNRHIVDAASFGIVAYEASGECVLANEAAARIMGTSRRQLLEQNFRQIGSWQASGLLDAALEALSSGRMTRRQVHLTSTYGREAWLDCRFRSFRLKRSPHLLTLVDDVTEQKQMERQLVRQERLATLGQLAGGIAHELRNPMGAVQNAAYFLGMVLEDPDPDVQEALEIMDREVGQCEGIIRSLLSFVSTHPPKRQELALNAVVREALGETKVPPGVDVVTALDENLPAVHGEDNRLGQVFRNLLENAVQAMPEGGRLTVKTWAIGDGSRTSPGREAIVTVADTGIGIAVEQMEKIFEPLFTTKAKGIGLGLALVRQLVERHGGTVEVESEIGRGTTFTVRLPLEAGGTDGER